MYYLGIDLGGTNIAAGLVNEEFKIVAKASVRFYPLIPGKVTDEKTTESIYYLSENDFLKLAEKVNK